MSGDWSATPTIPDVAAAAAAEEPTEYDMSEVAADAGARALCAAIGFDFDDLSEHPREHYREIARAVFIATVDAIVGFARAHRAVLAGADRETAQ